MYGYIRHTLWKKVIKWCRLVFVLSDSSLIGYSVFYNLTTLRTIRLCTSVSSFKLLIKSLEWKIIQYQYKYISSHRFRTVWLDLLKSAHRHRYSVEGVGDQALEPCERYGLDTTPAGEEVNFSWSQRRFLLVFKFYPDFKIKKFCS